MKKKKKRCGSMGTTAVMGVGHGVYLYIIY